MAEPLRLFVDDKGITHWRYAQRGLICVCGYMLSIRSDSSRHLAIEATHPTCLRCIAAVQTNKHRGEIW